MKDNMSSSEKILGQKLSATDRLVAMPWSVVMIYILASISIGAFVVSDAQPNWQPPLERELTKVGGTFSGSNYTGLAYRPYVFVDDSGFHHDLGCEPETRVLNCLETARTSLNEIAGQHLVIGYFEVHTPRWEPRRAGYPEILMTVDAPSHSIISFATSDARIRKFQAMQNRTGTIFFVVEIAIPLLFLFLATRITFAKLKANRRGR